MNLSVIGSPAVARMALLAAALSDGNFKTLLYPTDTRHRAVVYSGAPS
jgi:hypothetical protein